MIGIVYSMRKAGMPGPVTRLVSCTPEDWERLPQADRELEFEGVATHMAPSYSVHPRTGDVYPGINKPVAVIDWLAHTDVREDYVLVIDADMIMRRPVLPQELGAAPGTAVSGFFGYMVGVENELALRHVPEVEPRQDSLAGPVGRRGDQVGGFTLMEREDLRRVGPLWLQLSEDVRFDPKAWNLTGDHYAREGERPWIAEMYGYSFGCSRAGVWHRVHTTAMLYPGYEVGLEHFQEPVRVLHYGILWEVGAGSGYSFDKHWHYDFQALACPPWNLSSSPHSAKRGLFAHPPRPSSLATTGASFLRDLLAIEVISTLNEAFCDRHRKVCPPSEELERECGTAEEIAREVAAAHASLEIPPELVQQAEEAAEEQQAQAAEAAEEAPGPYPYHERDIVAEGIAQHPERRAERAAAAADAEDPAWDSEAAAEAYHAEAGAEDWDEAAAAEADHGEAGADDWEHSEAAGQAYHGEAGAEDWEDSEAAPPAYYEEAEADDWEDFQAEADHEQAAEEWEEGEPQDGSEWETAEERSVEGLAEEDSQQATQYTAADEAGTGSDACEPHTEL